MKKFFTLTQNELSELVGGDSKSYCAGLIAGRIFRKRLLNQPITKEDLKCNRK
ncbi:hypothetical protein [Streptococcus pluranimalium]